jgi:DHA1 family tetracycline resistance protein-like MFS transporter
VHVRGQRQVAAILVALFLWMLAHQVMPSTWSYHAMLRFGWSEALIGASLAAAGLVMATSQAFLMRLLVPRAGERRVVMLGMLVAGVGYLGYALATRGWMLFAWLGTWLLGALVMPSSNALMSRQVAHDVQGELQGAVASLYSLSSVVGPPLMTHLFARFSSSAAPIFLPGAAFVGAAVLTAASFVLFRRATRADVRVRSIAESDAP